MTDWSVISEEWGTFLSQVFDEWQANDQGRVKINLFESLFAQLNGQPSLMCTSSPFCGKNVALEHDGRVYSCDHFVYPEYELGKVGGPDARRDGVLAEAARVSVWTSTTRCPASAALARTSSCAGASARARAS